LHEAIQQARLAHIRLSDNGNLYPFPIKIRIIEFVYHVINRRNNRFFKNRFIKIKTDLIILFFFMIINEIASHIIAKIISKIY